jgi:hypothetical protein
MAGALAAAALGFWLRQTLLADVAPVARTLMLSLAYGLAYLLIVAGLFGLRSPLFTILSLVGWRSHLQPRGHELQPIAKAPDYERV